MRLVMSIIIFCLFFLAYYYYFFFFCSYHSHNNDYLEICRSYKAIYDIPVVKEDPAQWIPVKLSSPRNTHMHTLLFGNTPNLFLMNKKKLLNCRC